MYQAQYEVPQVHQDLEAADTTVVVVHEAVYRSPDTTVVVVRKAVYGSDATTTVIATADESNNR